MTTGAKLTRRAAVGMLGLLAAPSLGRAQADYPNRLIKLIVPFAAGGSTDLVARFIAERMRDRRNAVHREVGARWIHAAARRGFDARDQSAFAQDAAL